MRSEPAQKWSNISSWATCPIMPKNIVNISLGPRATCRPRPPRRSRPWSQGNLAGGASADCRLALYGLLRTGRGRGSWATAPRPPGIPSEGMYTRGRPGGSASVCVCVKDARRDRDPADDPTGGAVWKFVTRSKTAGPQQLQQSLLQLYLGQLAILRG
jgi:hypothetical protein